ncbi:hypothetical protein C2845_PM01G04270 [Panicum miliaceum]|uniref:Uncharacterized protein n=1 Tax=Panicum miliaceum TaxID=4540 RepID=A0A3L6TRZ6_PANMI|nr:hypothetical protein C2845_PM01G04270 [Panicum miliaceum]
MLDHERWAAASSYALSFVNIRDCSREADGLNYRISSSASLPPSLLGRAAPSTLSSDASTLISASTTIATASAGSYSRRVQMTPNPPFYIGVSSQRQ